MEQQKAVRPLLSSSSLQLERARTRNWGQWHQPLILLIPNNQVGGLSFQNAIEIQYAFNTPNLDLKITNVPLLNVIAKRISLFWVNKWPIYARDEE